MAGETATQQVDEKQNEVLSQETEKVENQESNPPVKEKTPEERKRDAEFYQRRQLNKAWRQRESELSDEKFAMSSAEEAARELGVDPKDEETDRNLKFIAKSHSKLEKSKNDARRNIRVQASNEILTDTFNDLKLDPKHPKTQIIGNYLFKKFGTENPDVFSDRDLIEREIGTLRSMFSDEKKVNPVQQDVLKKAASVNPKTESRGTQTNPKNVSEIEENASRMGVSKERAEKLLELKKKVKKF